MGGCFSMYKSTIIDIEHYLMIPQNLVHYVNE